MDDLIQKAATLQEALPCIRGFRGDIFVIKYGGHAMVDAELRDSFARDVVLMKYLGLHPGGSASWKPAENLMDLPNGPERANICTERPTSASK